MRTLHFAYNQTTEPHPVLRRSCWLPGAAMCRQTALTSASWTVMQLYIIQYIYHIQLALTGWLCRMRPVPDHQMYRTGSGMNPCTTLYNFEPIIDIHSLVAKKHHCRDSELFTVLTSGSNACSRALCSISYACFFFVLEIRIRVHSSRNGCKRLVLWAVGLEHSRR